MQENLVRSLGREDPLEKEMATHSSTLAWKIPGQRSLVGYSQWDHKELDMTEQLCFHFLHILVTTSLFPISVSVSFLLLVCCIFFILCISDIIQYLSFSVQLMSLTITQVHASCFSFLKIYVFIYECARSSLLCVGFL